MASKDQQHSGSNKHHMADLGRKGGQHSHDKEQKSSPSRTDQGASRSDSRESRSDGSQRSNAKR